MGIAQISRDMLQDGVWHRCACVKLSTKGEFAPFFGGRAKVSHKRVFTTIDHRNTAARNGWNAAKTSVRAPGLSAN